MPRVMDRKVGLEVAPASPEPRYARKLSFSAYAVSLLSTGKHLG